MPKFMNLTKVITGPETRWSYANVWDPKSIDGGKPKYSISLIVSKDDTETVMSDHFIITHSCIFPPCFHLHI